MNQPTRQPAITAKRGELADFVYKPPHPTFLFIGRRYVEESAPFLPRAGFFDLAAVASFVCGPPAEFEKQADGSS